MNPLEFLEAVGRHWVVLSTGALVTLLALMEARRRGLRFWTPLAAGLGATVAVVVFLAWADERDAADEAGAREAGLTTQVRYLSGQVKAKEALLTVSGFQSSQRQASDVSRETEFQTVQQTASECQAEVQRDQEVLNQCLSRLAGKSTSRPRSWTFEITPPEESKKTAPHSATFVAVTNVTSTPLKGVILCRGPFTSANPRLLGSAAIKLSDTGMRSPSSYGFTLQSPPWTPEMPLIIDVFFNGEDPAPCTLQRS